MLPKVEEGEAKVALESSLAAVQDDIDAVTAQVLSSGSVTSPALSHYAMPSVGGSRLPDATAYGIVLNARGVAINSLKDAITTSEANDIAVVSTTIEHTQANTLQTPGIKVGDKFQVGLQSEVWRAIDWSNAAG